MARPPEPEKRRELAMEAVRVLARLGLSTPMSRVADELGVKRPTLHYHFPSRAHRRLDGPAHDDARGPRAGAPVLVGPPPRSAQNRKEERQKEMNGTAFPESGLGKDEIMSALGRARAHDLKSDGTAFAFVYEPGDEARAISREAFAACMGA